MALCAVVVQTFLSTHELSLCLHSSPAVFHKCRLKLWTSDGVDKYSVISGAFYQLLNSMLVHRTETVFRVVPAFTRAIKRILLSLTCHIFMSSCPFAAFCEFGLYKWHYYYYYLSATMLSLWENSYSYCHRVLDLLCGSTLQCLHPAPRICRLQGLCKTDVICCLHSIPERYHGLINPVS